ncbi:hypothetical protein A0256_21115 [Mucilaginibacter sp. PAMC 26640]|nr:hypothetical protein A0256_21115 [Mucilaginibacter sp. PAMC 26640]
MYNKKLLFLILCLLPVAAILTQCLSEKKAADPRGPEYAGQATCNSCHKNIGSSYLHTAHYMASLPGDAKSIQGSFASDSNTVIYNDHTKIKFQKTDSGYYQTSFVNGEKTQSARMDITMGGVKGESYLYWNENELLQLPGSYDNKKRHWIISPGYDTTIASFDRMITQLCMECHASFTRTEAAKVASFGGDVVGFEKGSVILSIDCERCHGPAAQHVKFHQDNPAEKKAKYLTVISALSRQAKIDLCGTCHSGTSTITSKSIFDFKPGDKLADFKKHAPSATPLDYAHIDVHGDQMDMLKTSKCFISSQMDCSTCHNTHQNERNNLTAYTSRCLTCHTTAKHNLCKLTGKVDQAILSAKCISCHMPALPSKAIINESESVLVNTHHIAIYPDEAKKVLNYLKK